jgi:hypothetical protein
MTNLINAIVETYTNTTELYIRENNTTGKEDGWRFVDTLRFHAERKLKREIQDLEFWIPRQSDREANAKRWAQKYRSQYTGDEISTTNLKSSVAQWEAESFGLRVMREDLAAAQAAYLEMTGVKYTSIESKPDAEIPEDIAATLAAMDAMGGANDSDVKRRYKKKA